MHHDIRKTVLSLKHFYNCRIFYCIVIYMFLAARADAQWISNPDKNTLLVNNCFNPINISSVDDGIGGVFIFWEDNKTGFQPDINFLHVNGDGIVSFRSDGKKVTESGSPGNNPICTSGLPNSAYVVWKEKGFGIAEHIKAQRVSSSGSLYWDTYGIDVTPGTKPTGDYSASSDKNGRLFISYILKDNDYGEDYAVRLQVINPYGKLIFPDGLTVVRNGNRKSNVVTTADTSGNINLFWLENISGKTVLSGQSIDLNGKLRWGTKPVVISNPSENVISFNVKMYNRSVYVVWQSQKQDKDIFHQVISSSGKFLWSRYGNQVLPHNGNQYYPQSLISGDKIFLTWTDDSAGDKNIRIQKFDESGKYLWERNGRSVIEVKGDQFGQKILPDGKQGAVIIWIDRRSASLHGNIFAQRINSEGKPLWDPLGISIASSRNTEKSYISVIPDVTGGAVVLFKEKRKGRNEIFGQKVFNTGTFTSQIIAFNSALEGDSVKISWYTANETGTGSFRIERSAQSEASSAAWQTIGELISDGKAAARYYDYYDKPAITGTIYYRVVHFDKNGNIQPSDISKINYFGDKTEVFVAQNSPNPFSTKTKINIYLPEPSEVKIEFFDSHIEKVKEIETSMSAGLNEVEFSGEGLLPGIYFYKVHINEYVDVKKMVIAN